MNEDFENEYALEELENIKAKTDLYKSVSLLMNIISATIIISVAMLIFYFLKTAEIIAQIFN